MVGQRAIPQDIGDFQQRGLTDYDPQPVAASQVADSARSLGMPLSIFKVLTGKALEAAPMEVTLSTPREASTISEKTLGDFIRMVRLTGILKLPKADDLA